MHWRDKSNTTSFLETEDRYGQAHILASVQLVFGEWEARRRDNSLIGKFSTEEEAQAMTTVTIRMEQADEPTRLEPTTRRPHFFIRRR
jgi:hypothetical protein